jgi:hypothetical protein
VIQRFQIEDLIVQDASGVVFRALDTDSGKTVAVRRFFPFGVDGGGLHADEQTAYNIALQRLAGLSHPSLRSVICGGCDPVDGMPYIATEWIEGEPLEPVIARGPLSTEAAVTLITQALEVSELLSHVLAEEAVWVETELNTIVVGSQESGREFTFWISPLKWLGGNGENRGLESIVTLAEEIMGWKGRVVNDQAGRGLGGWLKWLRAAATTTSLHEAREALAASVGAEPPAPAKILVATATKPMIRTVKPVSSKTPLIVAAALVIVGVGLGGWLWQRQRMNLDLAKQAVPLPAPAPAAAPVAKPDPAGEVAVKPADPQPVPEVVEPAPVAPAPEPPAAAPTREEEDDLARANRLAAELSAQAANVEKKAEVNLAAQQAAFEKQGGVFSPEHRELLILQDNKEVTLTGVLEKFDYSGTKKTMYLLFAGDTGWNAARGSIIVSTAPADLTEDALKPLVGKKVLLRGKVEVQKGAGQQRPLVVIKQRAAIKAAD